MNKKDGFTLIEVMIAVVIISIAIVPLMEVLTINIKAMMVAKQKFLAVHYAKTLLEEIKMKKFDESDVAPFSIGKEQNGINNENNRLDEPTNSKYGYDDVDDYNGYTETNGIIDLVTGNIETGTEGFYRSVEVFVADDTTLVTEAAISTSKKTKKVIVKCYHTSDTVNPLAMLEWYSIK